MEVSFPSYYDTFQCLASTCPDSCCKEWAVAIDEDSVQRYRSLSGELGDALRAALQEEDGETVLSLRPDRRCPMWQDDRLCRIQAELGEDALCHTCKTFPRLRHDYGRFVELGLELSCPEAARLILSCDDWRICTQHVPGGEQPDWDTAAMETLLRSRQEIREFLARRDMPVNQSLAVLLLYGHYVQAELDTGDVAVLDPKRLLAAADSVAKPSKFTDLAAFFQGLEILTPQWAQRLRQMQDSAWSEPLRNMARYLIDRYWLQAVSDYDLIGRVKLIVVSCLLVKGLGDDVFETAQLFSKEIENDADNIDAILDGAYNAPALADASLLGLLLRQKNTKTP